MQTHDKCIRSTDAVKAVIEGFKLSIDGTVQQIVDVLLNIFYDTMTTLVTSVTIRNVNKH